MGDKRDDRNEQLKPGYAITKPTTVKGHRMHKVSTVYKKEGTPGDEYIVTVPKLGASTVIIPDTMELTKAWMVNNLGRQLQKELKVSYYDVYIYENKDEETYGTYPDLWKSEQECE